MWVAVVFVHLLPATLNRSENGVPAWLPGAQDCIGLKPGLQSALSELPTLSRLTADRLKLLPHLNNMRALIGV